MFFIFFSKTTACFLSPDNVRESGNHPLQIRQGSTFSRRHRASGGVIPAQGFERYRQNDILCPYRAIRRGSTNRSHEPCVRWPGRAQLENGRRGRLSDSIRINDGLRTKQSGAKGMGSGAELTRRTGCSSHGFRESNPETPPGTDAVERLAVKSFRCSALSMSCIEPSVFESAQSRRCAIVSSHVRRAALSHEAEDLLVPDGISACARERPRGARCLKRMQVCRLTAAAISRHCSSA